MKELAVTTGTTLEALASFVNALPAGSLLGGRSGVDGAVILRVADSDGVGASLRERLAARVAVEVVVQQVAGMPGAAALLKNIAEQFDDDHGARAGWLAPPLTILARIYRKTVNALPESARPGQAMHCHALHADLVNDPGCPPTLNLEQRMAVEKLIDRLMLLPQPGKVHGKT